SVTSPHPMTPQRTVSIPFLTARGAPPPLALARRRPLRGASLRRLARAAGALSLLAGPHPRSLSLGGATPRRFTPSPRSGRRRSLTARGAPPPLALARRRHSAALHSVASLGPQALSHCSRGPTPARSRSAAPLRGASLRRLARAAGALSLPAGPDFSLTRLCQQLLDHVAVDVCQSEFPALELVGQLGVIETHQMKDGRVQIVNFDGILDDVVPKVVGLPDGDPRLHAAASHPDSEGPRMVIAPHQLR